MRESLHHDQTDITWNRSLDPPAAPPPPMRAELQILLTQAMQKGATDVHVATGFPLLFRLDGELVPVTRGPLDAATVRRLSYSVLSRQQIEDFERDRECDSVLSQDGLGRYRINLSFVNGEVAAVFRILPVAPLPLESLKLPPVVYRLPRARKGLILITGSTSQGKTTTFASLIDAINRMYRKNIITIEDPVEYVHPYKNSTVRQREVGKDTASFAAGLRAALRQDPDVIAIGEMRDFETIRIALTAAATGVLVLSTLHVYSIDKIIERVLSHAPDGGEGHLRSLLAEALLCVVHQELLSTADRGKRVACEVLVATDSVRNLIRNRGTFHLRNVIATGSRHGMRTMKESLDELRDEGAITEALGKVILESYG